MRTSTHVPIKNTRGSKRPKLLDFSIEQISLMCLQDLHLNRRITVSLASLESSILSVVDFDVLLKPVPV